MFKTTTYRHTHQIHHHHHQSFLKRNMILREILCNIKRYKYTRFLHITTINSWMHTWWRSLQRTRPRTRPTHQHSRQKNMLITCSRIRFTIRIVLTVRRILGKISTSSISRTCSKCGCTKENRLERLVMLFGCVWKVFLRRTH